MQFLVLKCTRKMGCGIYQVQQMKKAKKWDCKMCGLKQCFNKIFYKGSSKDCRLHVQKLNAAQSGFGRQECAHFGETSATITTNEMTPPAAQISRDINYFVESLPVGSKWGKFLPENKLKRKLDDTEEVEETRDDKAGFKGDADSDDTILNILNCKKTCIKNAVDVEKIEPKSWNFEDMDINSLFDD